MKGANAMSNKEASKTNKALEQPNINTFFALGNKCHYVSWFETSEFIALFFGGLWLLWKLKSEYFQKFLVKQRL